MKSFLSKSDTSNELTVKLSRKDVISIKKLLYIFSESEHNEFFLKPLYISNHIIYYSKPSGFTLFSYLENKISLSKFLKLINGFLNIIEYLIQNNLSCGCLVKQFKNIFVDEVTLQTKMIYVPFENAKSVDDTIPFFKKILRLTKLENNDDYIVIQEFISFLDTQNDFDIFEIKRYINNLESHLLKDNSSNFDDDFTDIMSSSANSEYGEDDYTTSMMLESDFDKEDDRTYIMDDDPDLIEDDSDIDFFSRQSSSVAQNYTINTPILKRLSTSENIYVNKPIFRVGKDRNIVDLYVNNPAISRSHADIIMKNNKFYIVDLKSKNKTYVNGEVLIPNQEKEIFNDDLLTLANEEFVFKI